MLSDSVSPSQPEVAQWGHRPTISVAVGCNTPMSLGLGHVVHFWGLDHVDSKWGGGVVLPTPLTSLQGNRELFGG